MRKIKRLEKIGKNIARKLARCPNIKSIAFTGSLARGFADEYTKDIDLICFCSRIPPIEERRKYLGKQMYLEHLSTQFFESFKLEDIRIDIVFKELDWIRQAIRNLNPYDEIGEKHNLSLIQTMKIILDKTGEIRKIKKKLNYPREYKVKKIEYQFSVLCNLKSSLEASIKRGDIPFIQWKFSDIINRYVNIIFALNDRFFSDPKWLEKYMRMFKVKPKGIVNDIRKICEMGNKPREIRKKMKILRHIIIELSEIIKKEVPEAKIKEGLKKLKKW